MRTLLVDPRTLHVPTTRLQGADPAKLARQLSLFGVGIDTMPPPLVSIGRFGGLVLLNGVTRATRVAKFLPGTQITVEIVDEDRPYYDERRLPTFGDVLP